MTEEARREESTAIPPEDIIDAPERPAGAGRFDERADYAGAEPMSVTGLVRRLIDDVATLFRKELAMATSEVLHSVDDAKAGLASMIGGVAVLYAGFIFLLLAATIGLSQVVAGWAAALIVGGAALLIGFIMVQASKKKLEPRNFAPHRTAEALRKDRQMIGRQPS